MEQFIKSLGNLDQKPSFKIKQDGRDLNISFIVKATKGDFTQSIRYNLQLSNLTYKGYYGIDILDYYTEDSFIGGVKVDDLSKLKSKLTEWGFKGVADKLVISYSECEEALNKEISELPIVKTLFKGLKLFDNLPLKEKVILRIKYYIENDKKSIWLAPDERKLMPTDFAVKYEKATLTTQDLNDLLNELEG